MNTLFLALIVSISLPGALVFADSEETEEFDDLLLKKGLIYMMSDNFEEAISYFDNVLEVDPDHVGALNSKGSALDKLRKYEESILYFDRVLEIDPNNEFALNSMGTSFGKLGKIEEAIPYFEKALEINPDNKDAEINLQTAIFSPEYKKEDGFVDIIIRDSKGNLIGFMRYEAPRVLTHPLLEDRLNEWRVDKVITRENQEFEVLKRKHEVVQEDDDPYSTVGVYTYSLESNPKFWLYYSTSTHCGAIFGFT